VIIDDSDFHSFAGDTIWLVFGALFLCVILVPLALLKLSVFRSRVHTNRILFTGCGCGAALGQKACTYTYVTAHCRILCSHCCKSAYSCCKLRGNYLFFLSFLDNFLYLIMMTARPITVDISGSGRLCVRQWHLFWPHCSCASSP
jgi:hypothetical protein